MPGDAVKGSAVVLDKILKDAGASELVIDEGEWKTAWVDCYRRGRQALIDGGRDMSKKFDPDAEEE